MRDEGAAGRARWRFLGLPRRAAASPMSASGAVSGSRTRSRRRRPSTRRRAGAFVLRACDSVDTSRSQARSTLTRRFELGRAPPLADAGTDATSGLTSVFTLARVAGHAGSRPVTVQPRFGRKEPSCDRRSASLARRMRHCGVVAAVAWPTSPPAPASPRSPLAVAVGVSPWLAAAARSGCAAGSRSCKPGAPDVRLEGSDTASARRGVATTLGALMAVSVLGPWVDQRLAAWVDERRAAARRQRASGVVVVLARGARRLRGRAWLTAPSAGGGVSARSPASAVTAATLDVRDVPRRRSCPSFDPGERARAVLCGADGGLGPSAATIASDCPAVDRASAWLCVVAVRLMHARLAGHAGADQRLRGLRLRRELPSLDQSGRGAVRDDTGRRRSDRGAYSGRWPRARRTCTRPSSGSTTGPTRPCPARR